LGGDLKFLNMVSGISSCACNYGCVWCKFPDLLHMFLRISDQLVNHLITELRVLDNLQRCKQWVRTLVMVYQTKDATPYMYILAYHVCDMIRLHGNLRSFSQQGFEKLNDCVTSWFFRSRCHRSRETLKQVMLKQNKTKQNGFFTDF
ncbi:uncharacterized protein LOC124142163, partial [Haliotis rufescens]|uniref:uncharacterized protein LOC124142163 n=1 Tax=Haliotis rufescens TaxID=6454 RepID=UPI00201F5CBD